MLLQASEIPLLSQTERTSLPCGWEFGYLPLETSDLGRHFLRDRLSSHEHFIKVKQFQKIRYHQERTPITTGDMRVGLLAALQLCLCNSKETCSQ